MNKLLLNEPPLMILPTLASNIGLNEAIFAQQLYYWLQKSSTFFDNRKWVYKSIKEWEKEFPFWSNSTIKRIINSLKIRKILLIKRDSHQIFYSISEKNIKKIKPKLKGQIELKVGQIELIKGQNEPKQGQFELAKGQNERKNGHIDPMKGQNDPSPIYNENQRDYTENTTETTQESTHRDSAPRGAESAFTHDWNDFALKNSLNQITSLTDSRKKKLQARLKNSDFKKLFDKALDEIKKSQYLLGAKGWKITFDWLIKNDENILKVVEGNYRDIKQKNSYANSPLNNLPKNYVVEEW